MPLLLKKVFKPNKCPSDLKPDSLVFFSPLTNEVFVSYDSFFERQIALNSMIWTCAATGKTSLTFEEALESERNAQESIHSFPDYLGTPLLFLVHYLSFRGRLDDLVDDLHMFIKSRYFVGEELIYIGERNKKLVRVLGISFVGENFTPKVGSEQDDLNSSSGRGTLLIGSAYEYKYTVQIINNDGTESDLGVREEVEHNELIRPKAFSSRVKLKLFLKNCCYSNSERMLVKRNLVEERGLDELSWIDVFAGPTAIFPRTPLVYRKGVLRPAKAIIAHESKTILHENDFQTSFESSKETGNSRIMNVSLNIEQSELLKKTRKREKKSDLARQEIILQQEELKVMIENAKKFGIEDLSRWKQERRLLSAGEINDLKQQIRNAKEKERAKIREAKQRERELFVEWKKPRDDLMCDDLKPLPNFALFTLPDWLGEDEWMECLQIYQFFQSFSELLPIKEVRRGSRIKISDIITAVHNQDPRSNMFVELMQILLKAKAERADEEDGDEATLNNKDDLAIDASYELDHKIYGESIRQATLLHENIRMTHGMSVRHLPTDCMTISEIIRLSLLTSGYYTGAATHRHRLQNRGGIRCFEDDGFLFVRNNTECMKILEKDSIFKLDSKQRLRILNVFVQQLMSYHKFRAFSEDKISILTDLRKELKNLRNFDINQEREAREATLLCEYEAEHENHGNNEINNLSIRKAPISEKTSYLLNFSRTLIENDVTGEKLNELKKLLLNGVSYGELAIDEIPFIRSLQQRFISEKEQEMLDEIYVLQANLGWNFLGRDRAFRLYWYFDSLSLLLVENPTIKDEIGECCGATPVDKISEDIRQLFIDENQMRYALPSCTSSNDCPVHCFKRRSRFQIIDSVETLNALIGACNPRGYREAELLENLKYFQSRLCGLLIHHSRRTSISDLLIANINPTISSFDFDWPNEMVKMLLDLENKIEQGGIGHLAIRNRSSNREKWRNGLLVERDISSFIQGDIKVFDDLMICHTDFAKLSVVNQIAIALLQIAQGLNIRFLQFPFVKQDSKDTCVNIPTTTFDSWQKSLLKCTSISAIALFFSTLNSAILWDKSRLQAKCRECRRKGVLEKLIVCIRCYRCYHIDCIKPKLSRVFENWLCSNCSSFKKIGETEQGKNKPKETNGSAEDDISDTSSHEENIDSIKKSRRRVANSGITSGRVVRRVIHVEQLSNAAKGSVKRKSNLEEATENGTDGSETEMRLKKRKIENYKRPIIPMSLRQADQQSRDSLRALESVIRDALKQVHAWPFFGPVDAKEVPDYYLIIKRPMDLRKIMNKLKRRLYDNPEEVISDIKLIFENCRLYNDENSEIRRCGDTLENFIDHKINELAIKIHANRRTRFGKR